MKLRIVKETKYNIFTDQTKEEFVIQYSYFGYFWSEYGDEFFYTCRSESIDCINKTLKHLYDIHGWEVVSKEVINE